MKKYFYLLSAILLIAPFMFVGCDNAIDSILPIQNNEVRANISDYGSFDSKDATTLSSQFTFDIKAPIKGESGEDTIVVTVLVPKQASAPYTVMVQNDDHARIDYCVQQSSGICINYDAYKNFGSGTITVNSMTTEGTVTVLQGTFSGTLKQSTGGGSGTVTITSGEFKVAF